MISYQKLEYGQPNYSKIFWENLLHRLENYCSSLEPFIYAKEGQLWYDSSNKILKIATSPSKNSGALEWKALKSDSVDFNLYINENSSNEILNLKLKDDVNGETVYEGVNKNSNHTVTKKYADNYHGGIIELKSDNYHGFKYPNGYIILYGKTVGDIILPYEMNMNYSVVCTNTENFKYGRITKKTSKSFFTNSDNWLMVGYHS